MFPPRLTWVVVGGVAALLVIAVADALRSSNSESTSPAVTVAATTTRNLLVPPNCARRQIAMSIEIRQGVATVVVQHVRGEPCFRASADFRFLITNRARHRIGLWTPPIFAESYELGEEKTFVLPDVFRCDRPGPFIAKATLGPYSARRGGLTRNQITC